MERNYDIQGNDARAFREPAKERRERQQFNQRLDIEKLNIKKESNYLKKMILALQMWKTIEEIFPATKSLSARDRKVTGGPKARKVAGGSSTTGRASTVAWPGKKDRSSLDWCDSRTRRYSNLAAPLFKNNSGSGGYDNNRDDDENSEDSEVRMMRMMRIVRMPKMMKMARMVMIMMVMLLPILVVLRSLVYDRSGIYCRGSWCPRSYLH